MKIYLTRHGESLNNLNNIIGGNSSITSEGIKYGKLLGLFFKNDDSLIVITSNLKRTVETAEQFTSKYTSYGNFNEINSGDFEGCNLDYIKKNHTFVYNSRERDKLNISYKNGENYKDLQERVISVLKNIDTTSKSNLLIISHQAVCRIIYSYFTNIHISKCLDKTFNLHTLYEINGDNYIIHSLIKN